MSIITASTVRRQDVAALPDTLRATVTARPSPKARASDMANQQVARRARSGVDVRRPWGHIGQPVIPGGRPTQPAVPFAAISCTASSSIRTQTQHTACAESHGWHLTERGLAVVMIGFLLAVAMGAFVVVNQYLALGSIA